MEKDGEKKEEVTKSSSDVYTTPIALGFEAQADTDNTSSSVVYGPMNYNESDTSAKVITFNKDVRDPLAIRGRCGLYNLGNTCFMNSGLQCLMSTMPLVKFLLGYYQTCTVDDTLFGKFQKLFAKIWSGHFSIVHPKDFKQTLGLYHTQFQDYRQHDCQEFLALLLDSLHEHLNFKSHSTNQNTEAGPSSEKQPITFEHNINNKTSGTSNLTSIEDGNCITDKSRNAATSHSSLTFDNMKETNVTQSEKLYELKTDRHKSGTNIAGFTVNLISEDSNHSTVSEQSSDSDQCCVMKNLKLRSSPTGCQLNGGLSPQVVNEIDEKLCDVSSSDDVHIGKDLDSECGKSKVILDCESSEPDCFRRVQSLQDFSQENERAESKISKASSDMDLVIKADVSIDEETSYDSEVKQEQKRKDLSFISKRESDLVGETVIDNPNVRGSKSDPVVLNNAVSATSVPSLDDIYAKETKTLNTNVLADYLEEAVTTDSEKFSKHDNTVDRSDAIEEEDIINNVMEVTTKTDRFEAPKKIKDVNIRADKKSKSPKGACGPNGMNTEKEDCFSLERVKRMKFEGTEKNLQMQEICKIQKERFLSEALKITKPKNVERVEQMSCTREATPSVDSDIESDIVDDQEEANEMEISDDNDGDIEGVILRKFEANSAMYTTSEVRSAEEAWQKYLRSNDSMIVDTFQGQFKSTVVCAQCSRVSVTFEPFMYLSVPVPHAMERQLCITYIPLKSEPTQLLLEMHKQDKILRVKQEICNLIGGEPSDIIIAEVLDWHISRILEDNTMLRYINDSSRKIYAFEMDQSTAGNIESYEPPSSQQEVSSSDSRNSVTVNADIFSDMGTYTVSSSMTMEPDNFSGSASYYDQMRQSECMADTSSDAMVGTAMWEWNDGPVEKRRGSLETEYDENLLADSTTSGNAGFSIAEDLAKVRKQQSDADKSVMSGSTLGGATDDWKSCAICLEEMPENELMVHTTCGGTFCSNCLEMSAQHYRDTVYCCPVCSTPADMTEDFVPLTSAANHKPKTRIVAIPISYRCEHDISGASNPHLFAHPSLLNLPSNLLGQHIHSCIRELKPDLRNFRILLTDGTGLHCSRCLYMEHCSGCEIPIDGEAILRPGDHLAVSVNTVMQDRAAAHQRVMFHRSMEKQRTDEPVTLLDCFRAFTQSEDLDEHNPWFCPHCKENQQAKKTMTVWQYPDTLIVQLKRFVFHELSSTKVDNKVVFPLDNLDLNEFISGPKTKNLVYNLYSLVCHFGGANSGHYTAYAKHPVDGKWYYYNDETVTESSPAEDEYSSTYVLFYQRKGTDKALQIPDDLELAYESDSSGNVSTSGAPSVQVLPPEGEISLNLNNMASSSSSGHHLLPSSGTCDLFDSDEGDQNRKKVVENPVDTVVDSTSAQAEIVEADSTGPNFEFYS